MHGPLVQLDRASVFETECREFESLKDHQTSCSHSSTGQSIGLRNRRLKVRILLVAPVYHP